MSDLLAGRFRLQHMIGDGTYAEVWRAEDHDAAAGGRPVALKIFRPPAGEGAWDPLHREVAAGQRMAPHRNIVRPWAVLRVRFFGRETPALAMEHVDGVNLALWLADQPPPRPDSIAPRLAVLCGLLRGIAHAHASGVAHQDISFGNVLVRRAATPDGLLTDFGCAGLEGSEATATAVNEDPAELQPINPPPYHLCLPFHDSLRRDVYAFGVLCHLALSGRHPLSDDWQAMRTGRWSGAAGPHATLRRRPLLELAPWLRQLDGMAALEDLLSRCVAGKPTARPASGVAAHAEWQAIIATMHRLLPPQAP